MLIARSFNELKVNFSILFLIKKEERLDERDFQFFLFIFFGLILFNLKLEFKIFPSPSFLITIFNSDFLFPTQNFF